MAADDLPHPMSEAEIIYADVAESNANALEKMIGGVIKPASMAREC